MKDEDLRSSDFIRSEPVIVPQPSRRDEDFGDLFLGKGTEETEDLRRT